MIPRRVSSPIRDKRKRGCDYVSAFELHIIGKLFRESTSPENDPPTLNDKWMKYMKWIRKANFWHTKPPVSAKNVYLVPGGNVKSAKRHPAKVETAKETGSYDFLVQNASTRATHYLYTVAALDLEGRDQAY